MVVYKGELQYYGSFGKFTYYPDGPAPPRNNGTNPRVSVNTMWDIASCTKVMGTTTVAAVLYQQGYLDLNTKVSKYLGSKFDSHGKAEITILNCLLHNAGFPEDPVPGYWQICPKDGVHPPEDFLCSGLIYDNLLNQQLINPVGQVYNYSDIGFITLSYVLGAIISTNSLVSHTDLRASCLQHLPNQPNSGLEFLCYYEAYLRIHILQKLGMTNTQYLIPQAQKAYVPPTRDDTWYRHQVSQGVVDDESAYAMGGISGNAGLFSTLSDIGLLMNVWLYRKQQNILNSTTINFWTTEYNHSQSSRALGWNTNDPSVPDKGWNQTCGKLSTSTFLHLGYTGTQICADPKSGILTVLLTNRVYPSGDNTKIQQLRQLWNDAVVDALLV